jgi:hypothetical protein
VNKKVDGQRKRKPEKKHRGESRYRKSYKWEGQGTKKEKKKERAIGGCKKKAIRKGRRRRMHGNKSPYRQ